MCFGDTFLKKLASTLGAGLSSEEVKTVEPGEHSFDHGHAEVTRRHIHGQGDDPRHLVDADVEPIDEFLVCQLEPTLWGMPSGNVEHFDQGYAISGIVRTG